MITTLLGRSRVETDAASERAILAVTRARRISLWLTAAAMILVIGLRSVPHVGLPWHWFGFPLLVVSLWIGRRDTDPNWP